MARQARSLKSAPELRFWACFAVVFALLTQAVFPMQAAAMSGTGRFVLCTEGGAPAVDTVSQKILGKAKPGLMGLKCVDCVIASITALPLPALVSVPAVYTSEAIVFRTPDAAPAVRARAPPRPHSCGPPFTVEA